mmetsp:Transcript_24184/g.37209  ORF Transcript_24184/g.37209 Transcript_24184/m.37209 type:complete len:85 (+) Transcript_24184:3051-3305(+)
MGPVNGQGENSVPLMATPLRNQEVDFLVDFYKLGWNHKMEVPIVMMVEYFESKNLMAFAAFELLHRETGKLNYGIQKLKLIRPI